MAKIKDYVFLLIETRKDPDNKEPRQYVCGVYATREKCARMKEHLKGCEKGSTFKIKEEAVIE